MNGILQTIYLFFGWQSEWYRNLSLFARENGSLWQTLFSFVRRGELPVTGLICPFGIRAVRKRRRALRDVLHPNSEPTS